MATTITGTTIDVNTAVLNRLSTDGTIVDLQKDGTSVGSIGSRAGVVSTIILNPASGNGAGLSGGTKTIVPADEAGIIDNDISLGISSHRFKDLYLSGGVYLGGTGAANLISDYETGSWTPTILAYSGTNPSVTGTMLGTYTKIGNRVILSFNGTGISVSGTTSGNLLFGGIPFTINDSGACGSWVTHKLNFIRPTMAHTLTNLGTGIGCLSSLDNGSWGWEFVNIINNGASFRASYTYLTNS
jgi:hypothetical protein